MAGIVPNSFSESGAIDKDKRERLCERQRTPRNGKKAVCLCDVKSQMLSFVLSAGARQFS